MKICKMDQTRIVSTLILANALAFSGSATADFVGLNIGASHWAPGISGSFNSGNDSSIDIVDDLGLDNNSSSSMVLILEHPIPLLPNIKYQGFNLDSSGTKTIDSDLNFNNQTFSTGNQVRSTFDVSHEDIVLYYELLDNWVNLDFGVDLKKFDGEVELSGITTTRIDVNTVIPLLYVSARFDLPFTGFYVGADFNSLSIGDNTVEDSTIKLGYESGSGLGVEGGLKTFSLELDDVDNLDTNLKYDGLYLNGYFHF
jgi:outer membrane protein